MVIYSGYRRFLVGFGSLVLASALAGCASSGVTPQAADSAVTQAGEVSSTASKSVGIVSKILQAVGLEKTSEPVGQQLQMRIFTARNLNAGNGDKALALVVKVYYLRSLSRFNAMSFDTFLSKKKVRSALGDDLIDSREMLLLPNQRYVSVEHLPATARYLGVVALFRSPSSLRWRFAYDAARSSKAGITLGMHACAMSSTSGSLVTALPDNAGSLASVHCPSAGS
jgi:type VI secretion system protein VasD